ncbi:hypothetical protein U0070_010072 [Myodes glareolus]|uniref:Carboxylesterase type B domain-containing protein n=1 Tax=Myodes glareolus TaxID=447135 RepID=A0AAW0HBQ3_MYOGA
MCQDSASPIRNTHTGQVRGSLVKVENTEVGVHTFLGIPFAMPPVGSLCFAPPEAPEPWSGVRDGTSYPAMCLQNDNMMNSEGPKKTKMVTASTSMSEDGLTSISTSQLMPMRALTCLVAGKSAFSGMSKKAFSAMVIVWIHGGALVIDMTSMYGRSMQAVTEDVIVHTYLNLSLSTVWVSWASSSEPTAVWGNALETSMPEATGTTWTKWLHHFGGHPDLVTIFGESVGDTSVSSRVVSPMSRVLFHRAIMESGVAMLTGLISSSSEVVHYYLQLNIQPAINQALQARSLQLWTKTLPQKIQELKQP